MTDTLHTLLVSGFLLSRLIVAAAVILAAGVTIIASKR